MNDALTFEELADALRDPERVAQLNLRDVDRLDKRIENLFSAVCAMRHIANSRRKAIWAAMQPHVEYEADGVTVAEPDSEGPFCLK